MYSLISSLLGLPSSGANSTISYVSAAFAIILLTVFIDLVYRLIRAVCTRGRFD